MGGEDGCSFPGKNDTPEYELSLGWSAECN